MGWKWVVAKFHCCTFAFEKREQAAPQQKASFLHSVCTVLAFGNPWDGTQTAQARQERVAEGPSARSSRRTSAERNGHEWTSKENKKNFRTNE
jgi:hypothetical protein